MPSNAHWLISQIPLAIGKQIAPTKANMLTNGWTSLKEAAHFFNYIVISNNIEHMMIASTEIMKGTKHEDDWLIYHDALSIMTSEKTKEWMH